MGRSLGKGMREFKEAVSGDDDKVSAPPPAELPSPPAEPVGTTEADAQSEKAERETVS
jgi:Sec-independent protein translocase protein TatA